jgi:pimeloyl-ACP methyl ester carboxylesterase
VQHVDSHGELDVRGLRFTYRSAGPEDGREVLLLHGFPAYSREWTGQLESLTSARLHMVAPDQRGYGPGSLPQGVSAYRIDELVADVIAMLDALGWARVDLVGHDWGAVVAWHVAARDPERLRTLTAISTAHPQAMADALVSGGPQRQMSSYVGLLLKPDAEDMLLADDAAVLRGAYGGLEAADDYVERFSDRRLLTGALNWYRALDPSIKAGPIRVPTLYVWGEHDAFLGREAAEGTAHYVEAPYTFAPLDGGHWLPETHPDEVNRLLLRHLAQHYR